MESPWTDEEFLKSKDIFTHQSNLSQNRCISCNKILATSLNTASTVAAAHSYFRTQNSLLRLHFTSCYVISLCKAVQARAPNRSVSCDTNTLAADSEAGAIPEFLIATPTPHKRTRYEQSTDDSSCPLEVTSSTMNSTR